MHRTEPNSRQNPISSRRCRYKSTFFLKYVVEVGSAVIGSGAHVAMVAMNDNASGIVKSFLK